MAAVYEARYGVAGSVMYPSRSSASPVFEAKAAQALDRDDTMVIGYGGNSGPEMLACLTTLAASLEVLSLVAFLESTVKFLYYYIEEYYVIYNSC